MAFHLRNLQYGFSPQKSLLFGSAVVHYALLARGGPYWVVFRITKACKPLCHIQQNSCVFFLEKLSDINLKKGK